MNQSQWETSLIDGTGSSVPLQMGYDTLNGMPPIESSPMYTTPIQSINDDPLITSITVGEMSNKIQENMKETLMDTEIEDDEDLNDICNQKLYNMLIGDFSDIGCTRDMGELYPTANPVHGEFLWKSDVSVIYREFCDNREQENCKWLETNELKIAYTRWSPVMNRGSMSRSNSSKNRVLLIHDALDCRKAWWKSQRCLSPFFDTISVDLLGSGDSMKPRGLSGGQKFPWLYKAHAMCLLELASTLWPGLDFYVAGVGWGAQIAASLSSISDKVKGFIMINPPGFSKNIHPEMLN